MLRNDLLAWVDLEMTSLKDAHIDPITEVAIVLTDSELTVVAEGPNVVIYATDEQLDRIDPDYRHVYIENGLLAAVKKSVVTAQEAEQQILEFLGTYALPQTALLCGNSIHVDRHFLRIQMPRLEEYFFYRCIDVSSVKELTKRWVPEVYTEATRRKIHQSHRAKDDIHQSIEELKFYREQFFS